MEDYYAKYLYNNIIVNLTKYTIQIRTFLLELSISDIGAKNLNTPAWLLSRCPAVTSDENPRSPSGPVWY